MNVLVNCLYGADAVDEARVQALAAFAMGRLDLPEGSEVSLSFVDDDEMAQMNEGYRGKEGPTDVLSFECDSLDDGFPAAGEGAEGAYELGDVVIAPDVAERQCAQFGNGFAEEMELLLVHGLLHLCGYDHLVDAEAEAMEARERELLAAFRAQRP